MKNNYYLFFVLYLFSYCQVSPAVEFIATKNLQEINTDTELITAEDHQIATVDGQVQVREKRWIFAFVIAIAAGILSGTASRLIGDQISKLINGKRLKRSGDRVNQINQNLNLNYDNAVALKRKITSLDYVVGNAMLVSRQGFVCHEDFCRGKPTKHYALGLCSKYMCYCDNGSPGPLECGGGFVFDSRGYCNDPTTMALCGY